MQVAAVRASIWFCRIAGTAAGVSVIALGGLLLVFSGGDWLRIGLGAAGLILGVLVIVLFNIVASTLEIVVEILRRTKRD